MPSPPFAELFAALARALDAASAGWYLFGAQAALLHGVTRFTADVDVTVRLPDDDPRALVKALALAGFQMKILAERPKDIEDVVSILAAHPDDLDLDLVRSTLLLLEDALGQSDLLPAFERALERARTPAPAALRRAPGRAKQGRKRKPRPR